MRWEDLFDDLAAQAEAFETAERAAEVTERARIEFASLTLTDRLAAAVGNPVRVTCAGGTSLRGLLARSTPTWVLVTEAGGRDAVVPVAAIRTVAGTGPWARPAGLGGQVAARLGLASMLRGIARDRLPVRLHLSDGETLDGTIDRVGADFIELAIHSAGEWRRSAEVRGIAVVPTAALVAVRRGGVG